MGMFLNTHACIHLYHCMYIILFLGSHQCPGKPEDGRGGITDLILKVLSIPSCSDTASPALGSALGFQPTQMRENPSDLKPRMNARSMAFPPRTDQDKAPMKAIRCHGDSTGWAN